MTAAHTGVVIASSGSAEDALRCLTSLERSGDLDLDIVVVDRGSEDARDVLRTRVAGRAQVVVADDDLGHGAGLNLGIQLVVERGCELVWILDSGTVVEPRTLPMLRRHLDTVRDCGVVGPRLLSAGTPGRIWSDGGDVDPDLGRTSHRHAALAVDRAPRPVVLDVDYVSGGSMLVRRSMIDQIGLVPEHYFLSFEDVDWCRRAHTAGWRVMVDQRARAVHEERSSGPLPSPAHVYYLTRNSYLFARECLGLDGERTLASVRETDLGPWRAKVQQLAPRWLDSFDALVECAVKDALAGVHGRSDAIARFSLPEGLLEGANA